MHATEALREADRLMTVCNSCRYCEGICAVFPAMEMRRGFSSGDLNYFANLCHGCGACYDDCQFSPPHEFLVNVPKTLGTVRAQSYGAYAWPRGLAPVFERNGLAISLVAALGVVVFVGGFVAAADPRHILAAQPGSGAFYRLLPHNAMAALFGAAFLYALLAMGLGLRAFLRDATKPGEPQPRPAAVWRALRDAGRLRYLDGGGAGCASGEQRRDMRRHYHHATFYGFLLCFASTSIATLYHYLLGREAPYPWWDLPVLLGTVGGIGLVIGTAGLASEKMIRDPALRDDSRFGMDAAFLAMLFLTALTGLALLAMRETELLNVLLALHLGIVFALFITMPYGKMVHGLYRFAALVRYAREIDTLGNH